MSSAVLRTNKKLLIASTIFRNSCNSTAHWHLLDMRKANEKQMTERTDILLSNFCAVMCQWILHRGILLWQANTTQHTHRINCIPEECVFFFFIFISNWFRLERAKSSCVQLWAVQPVPFAVAKCIYVYVCVCSCNISIYCNDDELVQLLNKSKEQAALSVFVRIIWFGRFEYAAAAYIQSHDTRHRAITDHVNIMYLRTSKRTCRRTEQNEKIK